MIAVLRSCLVLLGLLVAVGPAAAQWTRIPDVQPSDVFSLWTSGDTIAAGADTAVYVSTNAGATWKRSAKVTPGGNTVDAVCVRNGRLYAGTLGQGVFVSDDLGTTWLGFNQGLVGGFADTQLRIKELLVRGDSLYAATDGAGPWVRNLVGAGTWGRYGDFNLLDTTAQDMLGIAASDTRVVAAAGSNGASFFRDRGDANWTISFLDNLGFEAGLAPLSVVWTGHHWVMGTNIGLFLSASGQSPWTRVGPDLGLAFFLPFAVGDHELFAAFGIGLTSVLEFSGDDGATWQEIETRTNTGIYRLAINGNDLYAGRIDGLWRRPLATLAVPDDGPPARLGFAIAGSQPIGDEVRFRFDLPEPSAVTIEVFDVAGRRAADAIRGSWPAGRNESSWNARGLGPGFYVARLTAGSRRAVVRMVRAR